MFHRNQRHVHARHFSEIIGPLPCTVDNRFTQNFSIGSGPSVFNLYCGDLLIFNTDARHWSFFCDGYAVHPCAFGQSLRDV